MKKVLLIAFAAVSAASFATSINFDDGAVSEGSTLSNQYAGLGVTFVSGANGHSVPNWSGTSQGFATSTDLTITSTDVGGGLGSPMSGKLVHSFGGWLNEDGDPVFTMIFSGDVTSFSLYAGGIFDAGATGLYAFNAGGTQIGSVVAAGTNVQKLDLGALAGAREIVMTIGDFGDWVGADNIEFQMVPEPFTMATLGLGLAAMLRRRNKKA